LVFDVLTKREFDSAISAARWAAEMAQIDVPPDARNINLRIRRIYDKPAFLRI
jgi:hypothetical protein